MRKYEIMYILVPQLTEEARKAEMEKLHAILTQKAAKVLDIKEWGNRELAYEINELTRGYYVVIRIEGEAIAINEFDRLVKINANVIRHLITVAKD